MTIPKTVVACAVRYSVNVRRNDRGEYAVVCPVTLREVEWTRSARPTAANAIAMIRRYINQRQQED